MATFGQLKDEMLQEAGVSSHFQFIELSDRHRQLWEEMNSAEYHRGYNHEEYQKPGSPQLRDMELLDDAEYQQWMERFRALTASAET